jgi:hypothetical protein
MTDSPIENKVAQSGLVSFDLETLHVPGQRVQYDLKQNLYMELMLREKDFREFLKTHNWAQYSGQIVAITCTADAIVPTWAYMLLAGKLQPYAAKVGFGSVENLEAQLYLEAINSLDLSPFMAAKVVVKGCAKIPVPTSAFVALTNRLLPVVQSLMYGEPCSTVPLFKNKI